MLILTDHIPWIKFYLKNLPISPNEDFGFSSFLKFDITQKKSQMQSVKK